MFYVRPIAPDDLPAVLALSERTGAGLTTLPANRERLSERIARRWRRSVMVQIGDVEGPSKLEIGMPVRLEFRRICWDGEAGVIFYGHKAVPA